MKYYRVVLGGERKGDGYIATAFYRTPKSIHKQTVQIYNCPVSVFAEPNMTEELKSQITSQYLAGNFQFINLGDQVA